jgi:hypothetical protein
LASTVPLSGAEEMHAAFGARLSPGAGSTV